MKKFLAFILAGALAFSLCTAAAADDTADAAETEAASGEAEAESGAAATVAGMFGTITELESERMTVVSDSDENDAIVLTFSAQTPTVDAVTGLPAHDSLAVGAHVAVYYGPETTRSIPPQSNAVAVCVNLPEDGSLPLPSYGVIEAVHETGGVPGTVIEIRGVILTVNEDTKLLPYLTRENPTPEMLTVGTEIIAWYGIVALSFPAQATATQIVALKYGEAPFIPEEAPEEAPTNEEPEPAPEPQPAAPSRTDSSTVRVMVLNPDDPPNDNGYKTLIYRNLEGTDPPYVYGLVHVRTFCDFIGADPLYDAETKTATLTGKNSDGTDVIVKLINGGTTIEVNGELYDLAEYIDAPEEQRGLYYTVNVDGGLYLPFRAVGYAFMANISRDDETGDVTIEFNGAGPAEQAPTAPEPVIPADEPVAEEPAGEAPVEEEPVAEEEPAEEAPVEAEPIEAETAEE